MHEWMDGGMVGRRHAWMDDGMHRWTEGCIVGGKDVGMDERGQGWMDVMDGRHGWMDA